MAVPPCPNHVLFDAALAGAENGAEQSCHDEMGHEMPDPDSDGAESVEHDGEHQTESCCCDTTCCSERSASNLAEESLSAGSDCITGTVATWDAGANSRLALNRATARAPPLDAL